MPAAETWWKKTREQHLSVFIDHNDLPALNVQFAAMFCDVLPKLQANNLRAHVPMTHTNTRSFLRPEVHVSTKGYGHYQHQWSLAALPYL